MTKRDFYKAIISQVTDKEVIEMAQVELNRLDIKNEKAKVARLEKVANDQPIVNAICDYLKTHKVALASELAQVTNVSTSKVVAVTKKMVDDNIITCKKVKIAKVGERNSYSLLA